MLGSAPAALRRAAALNELKERVLLQIQALVDSQKATQEGATHEESRAEDPKDTRATEASYLARGLAERVEQLQLEHDRLVAYASSGLAGADTVQLGALLRVEEEGGERAIYFLLPVAGGEVIETEGLVVRVLSPGSLLGRELVGCSVGENVVIELPKGEMTLSVEEVI